MSDQNQAQLAALLALLASQQGKNPATGAPSNIPIPPPSASGSLDLSNLAKPTTSGSGLYETSSPRYGDSYGERRYPKENEYYRQSDRDDRNAPPRNSGYDDGHRLRDEPRDWDRSRERDYNRERDRDYDKRDPRRQGRYRERSISPAARRPHSPPGRDYEDQMAIDTMHVGMVIGRGGDTLRRVERESGARVQFAPESQSRPGVRIANLSGSASQVSAARAAIKALIENNMASKGSGRRDGHGSSGGSSGNRGKDVALPPGTNKLTFTVPDKCVGLIIGRGGESINEIQKRSGARVNIVPESQSVNGRRPVNLFGSDEANERARELIEVIVRQDELGIKKGQASSEPTRRPSPYEQTSGQTRSGLSFDGSTQYAESQPYPPQQQTTTSQYGSYQSLSRVIERLTQADPFQYLQSGSDQSASASDPATAQAWAAYYAQQQQGSGYPQYSDSGS